MHISFKLNKSQFEGFLRILSTATFDKNIMSGVQCEALKELLWNLYSRLGRRLPNLKTSGNNIILSAAESWAIFMVYDYCWNDIKGTYEQQLINYITGIIHQKTC